MYTDDTALLLNAKLPNRLEISSHIAVEMAIQYCQKYNLVINEAKSKQFVMGANKEEVGLLPNTVAVNLEKQKNTKPALITQEKQTNQDRKPF